MIWEAPFVGVLGFAVVSGGCSTELVRVEKCAEPVRFIELSIADSSVSPTGRAFVSECDFNLMGEKPIEVYGKKARAEVIGWLYDDQCGFPGGLVAVGETPDAQCEPDVTEGPASGS